MKFHYLFIRKYIKFRHPYKASRWLGVMKQLQVFTFRRKLIKCTFLYFSWKRNLGIFYILFYKLIFIIVDSRNMLLKTRGNPQTLKIRERRLENAHNKSKKVKKSSIVLNQNLNKLYLFMNTFAMFFHFSHTSSDLFKHCTRNSKEIWNYKANLYLDSIELLQNDNTPF